MTLEEKQKGFYVTKLVSPLAIRFSQQHVRPQFQDKRDVFKTCDEIECVEIDKHLLLKCPFPVIDVIRWEPKKRGKDGKAIVDHNGLEQFDRYGWFSMDNRRLLCMQEVAMRHWPKIYKCAVNVWHDLPTIRRAARKFKSSSSGQVCLIGESRKVEGVEWSWITRMPYSCSKALAIIESMDMCDDLEEIPTQRIADVIITRANRENWKTKAERNFEKTWDKRDDSTNTSSEEEPSRVNWWYRDLQGTVQGPFSAAAMCEWHVAGFFFPHLKVKSKTLGGAWHKLEDLWCEQWGPMKLNDNEEIRPRHVPDKDSAEFFWLRV